MNKIRKIQVNEMFEKVSALLDCPNVSEKYDNVYTVPIMADKDILEFFQTSKNIFDVDFDDENEMNNATPVPWSSKMRNTMKSMRRYI
ncbi:hypothetical protein TNCV_946761 [Trichonephila clavipes]|nr:hypothetical protein TNCV_946761 [Trichonephila clavipes]